MPQPNPVIWRGFIRLITSTEARIQTLLRAFMEKENATLRERRTKGAEVTAVIAELRGLIPEESYRMVRLSYEGAFTPQLRPAGRDIFNERSHFSNVHREAVNLLADNLSSRLGDAAQTLGRRVDDVFRRQGLLAAAEQAMAEQPIKLRSAQLQQRLEAQGMTAFEDVLGRKWRLSRYAEMSVRTTTSEANNRGVVNGVLSLGHDLVRVDKHEHETDVCSPYDGKVFSLTGNTPGYPVLDRVPPFHPNCLHSLLPARENYARKAA